MNINPRQMQQAMKRLGIQQQEIDAEQVIIRCADKDIVIDNPGVARINMMGEQTFQITGTSTERARDATPTISDDDVRTVAEQANCSPEKARQAIEKANGDLAKAILSLTSQ